MTIEEVLLELKNFGDENTKKTYEKHGAKEPLFGVKVADLKKILKKTKKNHELALQLFASGNSDAMYLAGLMADEKKITKEQLKDWVKKAYWYYLSEFAVAWIAAESAYGMELGLKWIESEEEGIASCGWATLANITAITEDDKLDVDTYSHLLDKVKQEVHQAQNRVRYTMNGFVIALGGYVKALTAKSQEVAKKIGKVDVYMGGTSCKVPFASDYIQKVIDKDRIGKKKKAARC